MVLWFCALGMILAACSSEADGSIGVSANEQTVETLRPAESDVTTVPPADTGDDDENDEDTEVDDATEDDADGALDQLDGGDEIGDLPEFVDEPSPPVGLTVVNTNEGTIEIAWDPSREDGVSRYEVLRSGAGGGSDRFEVSGTTFVDTGLNDGDVFSYRVVALRGSQASAPSELVTAQVGVDTNAPRRPGRPEIVETEVGLTLTWMLSEDVSGIAGYLVTREIDGVAVDIEVLGNVNTLQDDVAAGTVATYTIRAVDTSGNVSEPSRSTTLLTGTPADNVIVVVSAESDAGNTPATARLERELLDAGYTISWFEDGLFDSNITTSDDLVLLLGDVEGDGFDWNIFSTDATVIGLKGSFVQAGGIIDTLPKVDRIGSVIYDPPTKEPRTVGISTALPARVVFLPTNEQIPDLDVWARASSSSTRAVAGIIPEGAILATGDEAPGCRAFFPGNRVSLSETTEAGYDLLVEFVGDVDAACG